MKGAEIQTKVENPKQVTLWMKVNGATNSRICITRMEPLHWHDRDVSKLEQVQKNAARFVTNTYDPLNI